MKEWGRAILSAKKLWKSYLEEAKGLADRKETELAKCGAWARDELRRLYKMAKAPSIKAEW